MVVTNLLPRGESNFQELRDELKEAGEALHARETESVVEALEGFLAELEELREETDYEEAASNDSAYWLLKVNAEFVLSML